MTVWGNKAESSAQYFSLFIPRFRFLLQAQTYIRVTFLSLHPSLSRRHALTHTHARARKHARTHAFHRHFRHSCLQDEVFFPHPLCSSIYLFNLIILHLQIPDVFLVVYTVVITFKSLDTKEYTLFTKVGPTCIYFHYKNTFWTFLYKARGVTYSDSSFDDLSLVDKKNQLDVTFCILYFSSNSCSTCFGQPCAHHQELTTA